MQRGLLSEETKRKNETIQNYKQITNFENAIIKRKDKLIKKLYQENITLHKELSKQVNIVDFLERI